MKSKVYFIPVSQSDSPRDITGKTGKVISAGGTADYLPAAGTVVLKIHFGEEGNTGFVRPEYAAVIASAVSAKGCEVLISDTNTLYKGRRSNSAEHEELAREHGFTPDRCGAKLIIPDDSKKENTREIQLNGKFISTAKIAALYHDSAAIIGIAHFKGHIMTGFGGALKNIGMGCATREGKLAQHSDISPFVKEEDCVACKACIEACPADAIFIKHKAAFIQKEKCIGCATCIAICPKGAIEVDWESGGGTIQERMVEYAGAVLKGKKSFFINFAMKITAECDCLAKDDPRIAPDVGIFASEDPVAIDKACFDLTAKAAGKDVFKEAHPYRDGVKQLEYASSIGLGSLEYELINI